MAFWKKEKNNGIEQSVDLENSLKILSHIEIMQTILVSTNLNPALYSDINFSDKEWSSLLPENLNSFKMEEIRRSCSAYTDGIFPGSSAYNADKQVTKIQRFPNYIAYSIIVEDELVPISGQLFLTTKFYDRRAEGWGSSEIKKKATDEKSIMGYCINGDVYCAKDKDIVYKVFFLKVYKSLVEKTTPFTKLISMLKDGIALNLICKDEEFLKHFKEVLLNSLD